MGLYVISERKVYLDSGVRSPNSMRFIQKLLVDVEDPDFSHAFVAIAAAFHLRNTTVYLQKLCSGVYLQSLKETLLGRFWNQKAKVGFCILYRVFLLK